MGVSLHGNSSLDDSYHSLDFDSMITLWGSFSWSRQHGGPKRATERKDTRDPLEDLRRVKLSSSQGVGFDCRSDALSEKQARRVVFSKRPLTFLKLETLGLDDRGRQRCRKEGSGESPSRLGSPLCPRRKILIADADPHPLCEPQGPSNERKGG